MCNASDPFPVKWTAERGLVDTVETLQKRVREQDVELERCKAERNRLARDAQLMEMYRKSALAYHKERDDLQATVDKMTTDLKLLGWRYAPFEQSDLPSTGERFYVEVKGAADFGTVTTVHSDHIRFLSSGGIVSVQLSDIVRFKII